MITLTLAALALKDASPELNKAKSDIKMAHKNKRFVIPLRVGKYQELRKAKLAITQILEKCKKKKDF